MEENKDYKVHRSGGLTEGYKLAMEHTVSCADTDILPLAEQGAESIYAMRQESIEGERKAYDIVAAAANNGNSRLRSRRGLTGRWHTYIPRR